jgi:hypothetical protein
MLFVYFFTALRSNFLLTPSEAQIHEESRAMNEPIPTEAFEWGIISIKGKSRAS